MLLYAGLAYLAFRPVGALSRRLINWTAHSTAFVLWLAGADGRSDGWFVTSRYDTVRIIFECTAAYPAAMFAAAAISAPLRWKRTLLCLAVGLPAIFVLNVIRLASLSYIGYHFPDALDIAHHVVWPAILLCFTVGLFLTCVKVSSRETTPA